MNTIIMTCLPVEVAGVAAAGPGDQGLEEGKVREELVHLRQPLGLWEGCVCVGTYMCVHARVCVSSSSQIPYGRTRRMLRRYEA